MPESAWPEDYFIVDTEAHPLGHRRADAMFFPSADRTWQTILRSRRSRGNTRTEPPAGEDIATACLADMDAAGVDVTLCVRHDMRDTTGGYPVSTNGQMQAFCERAPERTLMTANVGPIARRGMDAALWELEYWVREQSVGAVKSYVPDETYMNDKSMWPFYAKCQELGVLLFLHTGMSVTLPQPSSYGHPLLLEEVCESFPDLRMVAFHMGWPWYREMIVQMQKFQNLYASISAWIEGFLYTSPWTAHQVLGEAMRDGVGHKLVWGTEWPAQSYTRLVPHVLEFQGMPDEEAQGYGLPPITDSFKRSLLGGTMATLLGVDAAPKRARRPAVPTVDGAIAGNTGGEGARDGD